MSAKGVFARLARLALPVAALAGCGGDETPNAAANASAAPSIEQVRAPNGDWTQAVVETAEGGFRMGNPDAPVKLVEYASLSCPYCARFEAEGGPALRDKYVRSGQVSWEYRTYMNHPTDPAASVLVHCLGAGPFFAVAEQLYATQEQWYGRVADAPPAQLERIQSLPITERNAQIARLAGFDQFFRQRGMPAAKFDACLADDQKLAKAAAITDLGNKEGVTGTPNFLINGRLVAEASDWKSLEPQLQAVLR